MSYFKCIGHLVGNLNLLNNTIHYNSSIIPVYYNKKFTYFKNSLTEEEKLELFDSAYKYVILPKTDSKDSKLTLEIIGLDKTSTEIGSLIFVNGKCVYENLNYNFNLINVRKNSNVDFNVKVYGELNYPKHNVGKMFSITAEIEESNLVIKFSRQTELLKISKKLN